MNVATVFTVSRENTGTDSINMPDAPLMRYANIVYHDIEAKIVSYINEHIFYNKMTINTIAWTEKYPLPLWGSAANVAWDWSTNTELRKLLTVGIKYSTTDTVYTKCQEVNQSAGELDIDTYKTAQYSGNPVFLIQDKTLYVYPAPTTIVTAWIKIEAIKKLIDLTTSSAETDIWIPWDYHRVWLIGIEYWIYKYRWLDKKRDAARAEYQRALREMIWEMSDFVVMPMERANPDLSDLMR